MNRKKIKRISVWQTSKTLTAVTFVASLIFAIPIALFVSGPHMASGSPMPGFFEFSGVLLAILLPVMYAISAFIFTAIFCALYNFIAPWTGGIEIVLEEDKEV